MKAHIISYADDFVILCRGTAQAARSRMEQMMQKLKLTVNPQKTRVCRVPEESFDFLGYTLGRCYRAKTGTPYLGSKPSKKAVAKVCTQIGQMTQRTLGWKETEVLVADLNQKLQGWANYFRLGSVHKAYRIVDGHVRYRLRRWLCHKHKVQGQGKNRFRDEYLNTELGLIRLERLKTNRPWANAT